jgi:glyoxylase-like metal-dependent hydrolase (beta-lactamase superfamily II)
MVEGMERSEDSQRTVAPRATPGEPVCLVEGLFLVAGPGITHPWDAAAYLVVAEHAALVDCGSGLGGVALDRAVERSGSRVEDVGFVVATHGHYDHVGGGAALRRRGLTVLVHEGDRDAVAGGDAGRTSAGPLYGQPFEPFEPLALHDRDHFNLGGATLDIVHTPGHTPGSICVVATVGACRVLLAGDTLWGGFSPAIGSDEQAWRGSLAKLAALRVDALTFGHGPARLLDDPAGRIAEARECFGSYYDPWFRAPRLHLRY